MILTAYPVATPLSGHICVPGDKSISHRALIFASLAEGRSRVSGLLEAEDTLATLEACRQLGVDIRRQSGGWRISGSGLRGLRQPAGSLDMGNSGTAMRLLTGVLAAQSFSTVVVGDASLSRRPMGRIIRPLRQMGAEITAAENQCAPLRISGTHLQNLYYDSPVASAQVKSCLLLAGLCSGSRVSLTEPVRSRDHSERLLAAMGVELQIEDLSVSIAPQQTLQGMDIQVPGDPSSAAFLALAATLQPESDILLQNVGINPTRCGFFTALKAMGARLEYLNQRQLNGEPVADIRVRGADLNGIQVPQAWIPSMIDELPALMVAAACARGETRIRGAEELRVKESDRLAVMTSGLQSLGVSLQEYEDGVDITGGSVDGGSVCGHGDHRCAMSFLVLGSRAADPIQVSGCEMIATSYPGFAGDMNRAGVRIETEDDDES